MLEEKNINPCVFNLGVECEAKDVCDKCGWNPDIAETRSAGVRNILENYSKYKELLDIRTHFDESVTDSQVSAMYQLLSQNLTEEGCIRLANTVVLSAINDVARWKVMTRLYPPTQGGKAPSKFKKDCVEKSASKLEKEASKKEYPLSIKKGLGKPVVYKTKQDYINKLQTEAKERAEKRWSEICTAGKTSQAAIDSPKWLGIWTSWEPSYINRLIEEKVQMIIENYDKEELPEIIFDFSETKEIPAEPKKNRKSARPNYWNIKWKNE